MSAGRRVEGPSSKSARLLRPRTADPLQPDRYGRPPKANRIEAHHNQPASNEDMEDGQDDSVTEGLSFPREQVYRLIRQERITLG